MCPPPAVAVPPVGVPPHTEGRQRVAPEGMAITTEIGGGKGSREVQENAMTSEVVVESGVGNGGGRLKGSRNKAGANTETAQQKRCREQKVSDI